MILIHKYIGKHSIIKPSQILQWQVCKVCNAVVDPISNSGQGYSNPLRRVCLVYRDHHAELLATSYVKQSVVLLPALC